MTAITELRILWITVFAVTATAQSCSSDTNQPIDVSVVSYSSEGIRNYSHILLDVSNNQIIVAARSELILLPYNLSSSQARKKNVSAAASDVAMCRSTQKEETCHNYFKLLLKDGNGGILACGTYADAPKCRFYDVKTLSDTTPSAWNSIRDFDGYVPKSPESSNTAVFTANRSLIVGSPRRPSAYAISRFTPGGKTLNILTVISGTDAARWLNAPDFVSSYEIGEFVYVFLREKALEVDSKYEFSRVARICKNDAGDTFILDKNWVSFAKSTISCDVPATNPPYHYDRVVGTTLVSKAMHNPDAASQDMFYAVFTGAVGSPPGSAVCAYGLSGKYMNDLSSVYNGQYYYWENGFKTDTPSKFMCSPGRAAFDAKKYQLTVDPVRQVTTFPLFTMDGVRATAIAVDQVTNGSETYDVIFLGFDDGKIRKISPVKSSSGNWKTKVVETIAVAVNEPILQLRVLTHSLISKRLLFVISSSKVSQLPVQRCERYVTCSDCISAQDPYCGWLSLQASCVVADAVGAIQNVTYGNYDSVCPKATVSVKSTSICVTVTCSPDFPPSHPRTSDSITATRARTSNSITVTKSPDFIPSQPRTSDGITVTSSRSPDMSPSQPRTSGSVIATRSPDFTPSQACPTDAGLQEPETDSGFISISHGAFVGISIGCFIVGVLVGVCVIVVAVQRSWLSKFSKQREYCPGNEHMHVSSAYELPELSHPQRTYDEIADVRRQEASSQLTTSPAYMTTGDR